MLGTQPGPQQPPQHPCCRGGQRAWIGEMLPLLDAVPTPEPQCLFKFPSGLPPAKLPANHTPSCPFFPGSHLQTVMLSQTCQTSLGTWDNGAGCTLRRRTRSYPSPAIDGLGSLEWFIESLWASVSPFVNVLGGDIHTSDFPI